MRGDLISQYVTGARRCYVVMWLQAHFSAKLGKDKHVWLDRVRAVASETLTQVSAVKFTANVSSHGRSEQPCLRDSPL